VWSISCLTYGISIPSGVFIPSVRAPIDSPVSTERVPMSTLCV
jgi:hypothetical protein